MDRRGVTLALKEHVGPDCPCRLEDRIRALDGVHEVYINPVADTARRQGVWWVLTPHLW